MANLDPGVVSSFGEEWSKFDHIARADADELKIFELYFGDFPWEQIRRDAVAFDLGCGSGRWAYFVAPRVGVLHCIDASAEALAVARRKLAVHSNCRFHCAAVDEIPLADDSADLGYSLGVLHHVPDTQAGISNCVRKLKPGAPFLLYLYYAFENRPAWYRWLWRFSEFGRSLVSRLPFFWKSKACDIFALTVYWPLARFASACGWLGMKVENFPLSAYRDRSFYEMRNDALDRFGTRLEKRFTQSQVRSMMAAAGLERISFRSFPCWCAVGYKKQ